MQNFFPKQHTGGAASSSRDLLLALRKKGHEIFVLTAEGDGFGNDILFDSGLQAIPKVHDSKMLKSPGAKLKWLGLASRNYRKTKSIIEQVSPNVIYIQNVEWLTQSPVTAAIDSGKRVVLHARNHSYADVWVSGRSSGIKKKILHSFHLYPSLDKANIIAVSNHIAGELAEKGFPKEKVAVIYNGISKSEFPKFDKGKNGAAKALMVGVVSKHKGAHIAIEAVNLLKRENIFLPLEIIGKSASEEYIEILKDYVKGNGLADRITFAGDMPKGKVLEKMMESKLVLVPSIWEEPFGRVAAEAMLCGAVAIVSDRGGLPEVAGDAGFVTEPTAESFAVAVREVLAMTDVERLEIRKKARQRAEELFDLDKNIAAIEKVLAA
jgi:glycosyltransferase involved in cell wall biosynthesis